jgi:hypothetical protein
MNTETPWRYLRKWERKWNVIDKSRYPNRGIVEDFLCCKSSESLKFIGYYKDDILCFFWGRGKAKFNRMSYGNIIFTLHTMAIKKIKEWIESNNYTGKVAFELCEFEQLNNVIEYIIQRNGFKTHRDNGYLFVNK